MNIWNLIQPQSRRTVRLIFHMIYKSTVTSLLTVKVFGQSISQIWMWGVHREGFSVAHPLYHCWIFPVNLSQEFVNMFRKVLFLFAGGRFLVGHSSKNWRHGHCWKFEWMNESCDDGSTDEWMELLENRFLGSLFFFDNGISSVEGSLRVKCTELRRVWLHEDSRSLTNDMAGIKCDLVVCRVETGLNFFVCWKYTASISINCRAKCQLSRFAVLNPRATRATHHWERTDRRSSSGKQEACTVPIRTWQCARTSKSKEKDPWCLIISWRWRFLIAQQSKPTLKMSGFYMYRHDIATACTATPKFL